MDQFQADNYNNVCYLRNAIYKLILLSIHSVWNFGPFA